MIIGFPIIRIFEKITKIFSKDRIKQAMTEEEIDSFIEAGKESGGIDEDEHERIKSILEFDDITVEEIMVPRVKMDAMNVDLTVEKAMTYFLSHTHTRIPVYS
jgi:CBS domain containing-hemolysin-like protein